MGFIYALSASGSGLSFAAFSPQIPALFPADSNALALPGGNGIFAATLTERITHYTLLRKVVCQGASPFGIPDNKTGCIFPLREHAALLLSAARFTVCM